MNFTQAIISCFYKYTIFTGRAIRSEYWYWRLFELILVLLAFRLDIIFFTENELGSFSLFIFFLTSIPGASVSIRRLHDINKSGWWLLLVFTGIGNFVLLYWFALKGNYGDNLYGPDYFFKKENSSYDL